MPKIRSLLAVRGERRPAIARALGVHAARPDVEIGGADTREQLIRQLRSGIWHALVIERAFEGDCKPILAALAEAMRTVRVIVIEANDTADSIAARVRNETDSALPATPGRADPETGLPACESVSELVAHSRRQPRTGLLSCVAIHASSSVETARVVTSSLAEGGVACRWRGLDIVAVRRTPAPGEACTWAEGVCSRLAGASVGVWWFDASAFYEDAIHRADHALSLAISRGPGALCTWPAVVALQHARRIRETVEAPQDRRAAFLSQLGPTLGPAQRHHVSTHSEEVADAAHRLAQLLRLPPEECERTRLAGMFHDIGKVVIPDDLLACPGALSPLQRRVMDRHAAEGAYICEVLGIDDAVTDIVRHHHTRFDSSQRAPDAARIVAVADAMITMTSTRPYSPARSFAHALSELRRCRGTIFDPRAVIAAHILGATTMAAAA